MNETTVKFGPGGQDPFVFQIHQSEDQGVTIGGLLRNGKVVVLDRAQLRPATEVEALAVAFAAGAMIGYGDDPDERVISEVQNEAQPEGKVLLTASANGFRLIVTTKLVDLIYGEQNIRRQYPIEFALSSFQIVSKELRWPALGLTDNSILANVLSDLIEEGA